MTVVTQDIPLVDLKAQYATIRGEVRQAIDEVLESMQLTIGPNVRAFYDISSGLEWRFAPDWAAQANYHRYENVGASDIEPSQKEEFELGLQRDLSKSQYIGVSFFRHIQFDAPNDQFSFIRLKWGFRF